MKLRIFVLFVLFSPAAFSQSVLRIDWRGKVVPGTVATLPTTPFSGQLAFVTDGSGATPCTTGGGTIKTICEYNGTSWDAYGGAGAGLSFPATVSGATSGGIPYFSSTTAMSSSALLASGIPVFGGGAGGAPTTTGTVPVGSGGTGITTAATGGLLGVSATNTFALCGPGTNTALFVWNTGGCPTTIAFAGSTTTLRGTSSSSNLTIQGGLDASVSVANGSLTVRGADNTGGASPGGAGGPILVRGGNNTDTNASSQAGPAGVYGGAAGTATPGHQGFVQIGQYYAKSGTSTPGNLQTMSTTEESTTDAGATPPFVIGVNQSTFSTSGILVIFAGEVQVNSSNTATIGHTVCAGATAGQVTDSGGTGTCSTGFMFGVVTRTSGSYNLPDGTTITLGTTTPAVKILGLR